MINIAVLLTVHNRKAKTLESLKKIFEQVGLENIILDVFVTDDGCTDGTKEAIFERFPTVKLIQGDGSLYWNRGMYKAWEKAVSTKEYDFFLWLNDDTLLSKEAIFSLLSDFKKLKIPSLICGATMSAFTGGITYSGRAKQESALIKPNGEPQRCEIINGNAVLIPNCVYKAIGNLDWTFRHAIGDFDYGLRAQKAGFPSYVSSEVIGICESNPKLPNWCLPEFSLKDRITNLYSPLGYAEPIPFFIYEKRHFGLFIAIKHFVSIHLRVLFPQLWKA